MEFNPSGDGLDHINVYSKGKTFLGRSLSNFAKTPFEIPSKGKFDTVEGFWYWTMTGLEKFRTLSGWECKKMGDSCKKNRSHPTEMELLEAYSAKLNSHPNIAEMLHNNKLPLAHYYVYNNKVVEPKEWAWTAQLWLKFKN